MKPTELIKQKQELDNQVEKIMSAAFYKAQNAQIIEHPYADYNDAPKFASGFNYEKAEITGDNVEIRGYVYAGCGENDYVHITIPISAFDNLDEWIQQKQNEIKAEAEEEARKEIQKQQETAVKQEEWERTEFERLKVKFGT